jgi:beta-glucanase (GH16 family)
MKYQNALLIAFVLLGCKKEITNTPLNVTTTYNVAKSTESDIRSAGYKLVWSDEFNYNGLPDPNYWDYETGFVRNNETQYYVARNLANSRVKNGVLTITALYDKTQRFPVTSASVITLNKMSFKYGRIEVSAKMPSGRGTWPAIWLLGNNRSVIDWPGCGEIDVMEWLGRAPQFVSGSIHTITASGDESSKVTPYFVLNYRSLSSRFHTYAIEWDSTVIRYYYDNVNYASYKASQMTKTEWAPFTKPFYVLLNLALGGTSGGAIDYSRFPFTYQIDYIRYYQKN